MTKAEQEKAKIKELANYMKSEKMQENIKKAEGMKYNAVRSVWFYNQVKTGGEWDPKYGGKPEMEHAGNFNYGLTGRASGYSEQTLLRAAGAYQEFRQSKNYDSANGHFYDLPLTGSNYGDDQKDQEMIKAGISYYDRIYGGRSW